MRIHNNYYFKGEEVNNERRDTVNGVLRITLHVVSHQCIQLYNLLHIYMSKNTLHNCVQF